MQGTLRSSALDAATDRPDVSGDRTRMEFDFRCAPWRHFMNLTLACSLLRVSASTATPFAAPPRHQDGRTVLEHSSSGEHSAGHLVPGAVGPLEASIDPEVEEPA